jgi:hypothetical protein
MQSFAWSKASVKSIVSIATISKSMSSSFRARAVFMERRYTSKSPDKDINEMTQEELEKFFTLNVQGKGICKG